MPSTKTDSSAVAESQIAAADVEKAISTQQFALRVTLPNGNDLKFQVTLNESIGDIRNAILENPSCFQYTCSYLSYKGRRLSDESTISTIPKFNLNDPLVLNIDKYNERFVRIHLMKIRDLLLGPKAAFSSHASFFPAVDSGICLFKDIVPKEEALLQDPEIEYVTLQNGSKARKMRESATEVDPHIQTTFDDFSFQQPDLADLGAFYPQSISSSVPRVLDVFGISGWNPCPPYRRIRGDIMYLSVSFIDQPSRFYHVTACPQGFFVQSSTNQKFNPAPASKTFPTLIELFCSISPSFKKGYARLLELWGEVTPGFELIPFFTALPAWNWIVRQASDSGKPVEATTHTFDMFRSLGSIGGTDLLLDSSGVEALRDWNDEVQTAKESYFPIDSNSASLSLIQRDRTLATTYTQFVQFAIQGVQAIAQGALTAVNHNEPDSEHIFIWNNIFFSYPTDTSNRYKTEGHNDPNEAARVAAAKDIEGTRQIEMAIAELNTQLDPSGKTRPLPLCTALCAVIDYQGRRVLCQSVLPGILRPQGAKIIYGCVEPELEDATNVEERKNMEDIKREVRCDEKFHEMLEPLAKKLHWDEHKVVDDFGKEQNIWFCADSRGIVATDNRFYILEPTRSTPTDLSFQDDLQKESNYPTYPHKFTLLRRELIDSYYHHELQTHVKRSKEEVEESRKQSKVVGEKGENSADGKSNTEDDSKQESPKEPIDLMPFINEFDLRFNLDIGSPWDQNLDGEKRVDQEATLKKACGYLKDIVVPSLVNELAVSSQIPMTGSALTSLLHRSGINIRYLGLIAQFIEEHQAKLNAIAATRLSALLSLVQREMIVRGFKHIARSLMVSSETWELPAATAKLLSSFLTPSETTWAIGKEEPSCTQLSDLTPELLHSMVRFEVAKRYRYEVNNEFFLGKEFTARHLPYLREACIKIGVQIKGRRYQSSANGGIIINEDDIVSHVPIVKFTDFRSSLAETPFNNGQYQLASGHPHQGISSLEEALFFHEQIYSQIHPQTIKVLSTIADFYLNLYNLVQSQPDQEVSSDQQLEYITKALEYQRVVVMASERVYGIDSIETASSYVGLAVIEHCMKRTRTAIRYMEHVERIWNLTYGLDHPDWISHLSSVASFLSALRQYPTASKLLRQVTEFYARNFGPSHTATLNINHQFAKALFFAGEYKEAIKVQKSVHSSWEEKAGKEHEKSTDSWNWVQLMTTLAVQHARMKTEKQANDQTKQLPMKVKNENGVLNAAASTKSDLSVEQALEYINGKGSKKIMGKENVGKSPSLSGGKKKKSKSKSK
ncbi:clustered mitochondria-domain-containing protein [Paraphysoderma sedebokerense]|nr:clustered mitochondria-domain-containing protein [Paraphysoderma sedebokerense]